MPKVNATTQLLYKDEVYALVGAAMEVYNELGPGFLEPVYQEAYEIELVSRKVPVVPQQELKVYLKGQVLRKAYIADYMAYAKLSLRSKRSIN